jgi:hypothetical protein
MDLDRVEILLFDLHLALNPLRDPSLLRPELGWLLNQGAYDELYRGEAPPGATPRFEIQRVRREMGRNHFWKAYAAAGSFSGSAWEQVVPFRFVPRHQLFPLEAAGELGAAEPRVRRWILVWPFGWSSNVHLTLREPMSLSQLQTRVGLVMGGAAFHSHGAALTLSEVFERLSGDLRADLGADGKRINDYPVRRRHLVVAVTASRPPMPHFRDLSQSDRARILSLLLGEKVQAGAVPDLEKKLLITKLTGTASAVTSFNEGTFLALSGASQSGRKGERSFSCMAHNLETATLIGLMLAELLRAAEKNPLAGESNGALLGGARRILAELPQQYQNRLCLELWESHGSLKPYWNAA